MYFEDVVNHNGVIVSVSKHGIGLLLEPLLKVSTPLIQADLVE